MIQLRFLDARHEEDRKDFYHTLTVLWPAISEDGSEGPGEADLPAVDLGGMDVLGIYVDGQYAGCWLLLGEGDAEFHTLILPEFKGQGYRLALAGLEWVFGSNLYHTLRTYVPEFNRPASRLVQALGFQEVRREIGAFRKDGWDHDVSFYQLTKEQYARSSNVGYHRNRDRSVHPVEPAAEEGG